MLTLREIDERRRAWESTYGRRATRLYLSVAHVAAHRDRLKPVLSAAPGAMELRMLSRQTFVGLDWYEDPRLEGDTIRFEAEPTMREAEAYREAARRAVISMPGHRVSVDHHAAVQTVNINRGADGDALGDGAYIEAQIWVPATEARKMLEPK